MREPMRAPGAAGASVEHVSDPEPPVEVKQAVPVETAQEPSNASETITGPAKLLRIASMVRELLEETRHTSLDESGRKRLAEVYQRSVEELGESISEDLREELAALAPPVGPVPTESEIRIAQAQLVGWLEGLFHGIQAAMFAQQAAARAQFEELRRRGLPGGQEDAPTDGPPRGGQYL
jgi:Bacterial proteasome activator